MLHQLLPHNMLSTMTLCACLVCCLDLATVLTEWPYGQFLTILFIRKKHIFFVRQLKKTFFFLGRETISPIES